MRGHFRPVRRLADALTDFAFPPKCIWCEQRLPRTADGSIERLCDSCRFVLVPPIADRCRRCSAPVGPNLDTAAGCSVCAGDRYAFQQAVSLSVYRDEFRTAILKAKRPGGDVLTMALAEQLCRVHQERLREWAADLIVPVPHHWTERLARPHLPPLAMAEGLGRFLMAPVGRHILAKRRRTPPQTSLQPTERRRNLVGAFRICGSARLDGLKILLVDDVMTTGTTAHRAARVLLEAGATRVTVAVLARGIGAEQPRSA